MGNANLLACLYPTAAAQEGRWQGVLSPIMAGHPPLLSAGCCSVKNDLDFLLTREKRGNWMRVVTVLWSIAVSRSRGSGGQGGMRLLHQSLLCAAARGSPECGHTGRRSQGPSGGCSWEGGCEEATLGISCLHLGGPTTAHRLTSGCLCEEQEIWAHL